MVIQLVIDDCAPDRLCGRVETSSSSVSGCIERVAFQDEQQLLDILRSIAHRCTSPDARTDEKSHAT